MQGEEYLTATDLRIAWIKTSANEFVPVTYANVDGLAVFEGCIILGKTDMIEKANRQIRNQPEIITKNEGTLGLAITNPGQKWGKNGEYYEIPFEIPRNLPEKEKIRSAIAHWEMNTKIRFKQRRGETSWVLFQPFKTCASFVGRQGGQQYIYVSPDCSEGNIIHEIGHTVGLWHEHSRTDRDSYIEVIVQNIAPMARHNFDKQSYNAVVLNEYDFDSIMHYPDWAFSNNGQPTIRTKTGVPREIGQRRALSAGDIAAVAALYP